MKRWLSIILSLFLALGLTAGAMAHATEQGVGTSAVASMDGCEGFSKKSDDGQSDPSKASVKFHGCHCHHVGIPVGAKPEPAPVVSLKAVPTRNGTGLSAPTRSDTFRPPIA
jgi:hypothetical protein